jgi:hypothetical protein
MERLAILLACLAITGHGRSVDEPHDLLFEALALRQDITEVDPLQALSVSLLALNPSRGIHSVRGITALGQHIPRSPLIMSDETTDTAEVEDTTEVEPSVVDVESVVGDVDLEIDSSGTVVADGLSIAKQNLASALSIGNGLNPDSMMQAEVTEEIQKLQVLSPTSTPSSSPLLNGKWEVVYAGAPGAGFTDSPTRPFAFALYVAPFQPSTVAQMLGKLPFDAASLDSVTVTIQSLDAGQPRAEAEASISLAGGNTATVGLRANLSPVSDISMREEFVEGEAFGQKTMLPGPLAVSRNLYIAFLDEEYLIVRDDTGLANVLKRLEKFPEASEPSYGEDDSAPGAG